MSNLAIIVNTAAGADRNTPSSAGINHNMRAYALRNFVLPALIESDSQVIVVGEWEPAPRGEYVYVECPSKYFDWRDALAQRQAGFEAASGFCHWHIYMHDDHYFEPMMAKLIASDIDEIKRKVADDKPHVIVPTRRTRLRNIGSEVVNNGAPDYIMGHAALYHSSVLKACPWGEVPHIREWDVAHTNQIKQAGFRIHFGDYAVYDIEPGARPWL